MRAKYASLFFFLALSFFSQNVLAQTSWPVRQVYLAKIHSTINPATLEYLKTCLTKAQQQHAPLVIELNTPGGLVSTTKDILALLGASQVPIVIWVGPDGASATSAGAIMASAADFLLMAQATNIGAATPIAGAGEDIPGKDLRAKAINDLVAQIRAQAHMHGRNAQAFASMITKADSFEADKALELKIIDAKADSHEQILKWLDGRSWNKKGQALVLKVETSAMEEIPMNSAQSLLNILAHPQLSYVFFLLGAVLIYFELQAPGGFIAGTIGVACLILSGIGFQVLPVNFGALGLIILSFVLFFLEIFVPSFGLLSLSALGCLIFGSLFLFQGQDGYVDLGLSVILSSAAAIGLFLAFITIYWLRDARKQKNNKTSFNQMQGKEGVIVAVLENHTPTQYLVQIGQESWKARSLNNLTYQLGQSVRILSQEQDQLILQIE